MCGWEMLATAVPFMSRHPALYDQAAFETRWMGLLGFGLDWMVLGGLDLGLGGLEYIYVG